LRAINTMEVGVLTVCPRYRPRRRSARARPLPTGSRFAVPIETAAGVTEAAACVFRDPALVQHAQRCGTRNTDRRVEVMGRVRHVQGVGCLTPELSWNKGRL
jgi:hypothetical protein